MPYSKEKLKQFLDAISQLESSGGKNTEHDVIQHGIQKGQQAIGRYGVLPNTAREFLRRRELKGEQLPPSLNDYKNIDDDELKQRISSDPQLEDTMAEDVAQHTLGKQAGDEERAAYAWKFGHNKELKDIDPIELEKSGRVKEFRKLKQAMQPETANTIPPNPRTPSMEELDEQIKNAYMKSLKGQK